MGQIGTYLISVCTCAIVCSVLTRILGSKGMVSAVVKMLCGIFMTVTVISPLLNISVRNLNDYTLNFQQDAEHVVGDGKQSAKEELASIITEQTCAYILDKANSMNVNLQVQVSLSEDDIPLPNSVTLKGNASPYAKQVISAWITSELGIPVEEQTWTT